MIWKKPRPKFFDTYRHLPPGIRAKARESYRLFVADPASVKFKAIKRLADGTSFARLASHATVAFLASWRTTL
jgi:hypothetical protein